MSNSIEHTASGKTGIFTAKYDQHAGRNGQPFTVLGAVDPQTYDVDECGAMFRIRFGDGAEIDAWPEEVEEGSEDMRAYKPGEWGTRDGLPAIVWWRHGIAAKGEPSVVQRVQKYASDADRIAAYQAFTTPGPASNRDALKNTLGHVAAKPFYIWANDDCANKSETIEDAKVIRLALINEGGESVYIVDADGVEVADAEIVAHEALVNAGYFAGARKPEVMPGSPGRFMVHCPQDQEGFAIVGDDIGALILVARCHLIEIEGEARSERSRG